MKVALCYPSAGHPIEEFLDATALLIELLRERGHDVSKSTTRRCPLLAQARSLIAHTAVQDGADVLLWIDDDIVFDPEEAVRLAEDCASGYPILGAVCTTKQPGGQFTLRCQPKTETVTFFEGGGILEVEAIGLGMTAVQRKVYEDVARTVPFVRSAVDLHFPAYFSDLIEDGVWPGEDIAFCIRARRLGHRCYVDTRVRTGHKGGYVFRLEDCTHAVPWLDTMTIRVSDKLMLESSPKTTKAS